jgi:uncharacterized protein YbjT (DUF2867 family)
MPDRSAAPASRAATVDSMTSRTALASIALAAALWAAPATAATLVLIAGASGRTGQLIARELVDRGFAVRGLTRDPAVAPEIAGVTWAAGDVTRPETLPPAFANVAIAVSAIGGREPAGADSFEHVDWDGNRALIDAAKTAGVRQMVLVTSGSAGEGSWADPRLARFGASRVWKAKAEAHLRASGLPYTIVAPGGLRDTPGGQQGVRLAARADYEVGPVARGDVAALVAACVANDACLKKTITIVNDPASPPGAWRAALAGQPVDTAESVRAPATSAKERPAP